MMMRAPRLLRSGLLLRLLAAAVRYDCPTMNCSYLRPARFTGRFAIVVSGQIRAAHNQLPTLRATIAANAPHAVDLVYHVWFNASAPCDALALAEVSAVARAVVAEPVECMWSYGSAFENQWRMVHAAFATLAALGEEHTLVLKTRADLLYDAPLRFAAVWARYARGAAAAAARGNFIVLELAKRGLDKHALGTPSLMKALTAYGAREGYGCDGQVDRFVYQRLVRYGAWPPAAFGPRRAELGFPLVRETRGAEPRCAPVFAERFETSTRRTPRAEPGERAEWRRCVEQRASPRDRTRRRGRRLNTKRPPSWVPRDRAYCEAHQQDAFFPRPD